MENEDNRTLRGLILGVVIYFVIASIPVLVLTKDKLRCEGGLLLGAALAIGMAVNMNMVVRKVIYMDEHQSAFAAWSSVGRLFVVAAVLALFGITGWLNVFFILIGVFGLKISAYAQPLLNKAIKKNKG